ncbi:MAG: flagellar basal body rod protein FlgB [Methylococcales bacterium]
MAINFDTALGLHPQALTLRGKRTEVLAANLANADTPGYKARDVDFQSVLKKVQPRPVTLEGTHSLHIQPPRQMLGASLQYRIPNQPSLDGNTVETHIEQAKFTENAMQYQASLRFVNGRVSSLLTALKGE